MGDRNSANAPRRHQGGTALTVLLMEIPLLRTFTTAAILALGMTAAHAEDVTTQVIYGDLDLSRPADDRILADRLHEAAKAVCLKANSDDIPSGMLHNCVDASVSMAMSRIEDRLDQDVHDKLINVRTVMQTP
jgi:UrcA family protein